MSGTPPAAAGGGGGAAAVAAAAADHFCLRWNNYQTNMTAVFDQLLQEEVMCCTDVALWVLTTLLRCLISVSVAARTSASLAIMSVLANVAVSSG